MRTRKSQKTSSNRFVAQKKVKGFFSATGLYSHLQKRKVIKLFPCRRQLFRFFVGFLLSRNLRRLLARLELFPTQDFTVSSIPVVTKGVCVRFGLSKRPFCRKVFGGESLQAHATKNIMNVLLAPRVWNIIASQQKLKIA